jgi:hypothetical protein
MRRRCRCWPDVRDQAEILARGVLERGEDEEETPYYRAATRAEALLLIGDLARPKTEFAAAIALAPQAYEDHASTLRQFASILDELGEDKAWLDPLRPPRSLHFAGHMALAGASDALGRNIRDTLRDERVGFGYGALAAGADILIAEALLEAGAELHRHPARLARAVSRNLRGAVRRRLGRAVRSHRRRRGNGLRAIAVEPGCAGRRSRSNWRRKSPWDRPPCRPAMLMTEAVQFLILDRNEAATIQRQRPDRRHLE